MCAPFLFNRRALLSTKARGVARYGAAWFRVPTTDFINILYSLLLLSITLHALRTRAHTPCRLPRLLVLPRPLADHNPARGVAGANARCQRYVAKTAAHTTHFRATTTPRLRHRAPASAACTPPYLAIVVCIARPFAVLRTLTAREPCAGRNRRTEQDGATHTVVGFALFVGGGGRNLLLTFWRRRRLYLNDVVRIFSGGCSGHYGNINRRGVGQETGTCGRQGMVGDRLGVGQDICFVHLG